MEDAARNNLQIKPPICKRKDCHPETKALIDQRLRALQNNDYEAIKDITKLLKKTARRTRVNQQTTSLKDHAWEPVKYLKINFVARHTQLRDRWGNLVPDNKRAEAQADDYEKVQWKLNETEEYKQLVIDTQPIYEESENLNTCIITLDELNFAIGRLKSNSTRTRWTTLRTIQMARRGKQNHSSWTSKEMLGHTSIRRLYEWCEPGDYI